MGRTLRSKKLRSLLYYAQDGKCAICGCELPDDWHADHIVPYVVTKRTNPFEMQALCPKCNLEKGKKTEMHQKSNYIFEMNFKAYRPGQRGAHDTILRKAMDKIVSIVLPTRYGKSDVIRCSFLDLYYQGIASCAVVLSPAEHLREQMKATDKIKDMMNRYQIRMPKKLNTFVPTVGGKDAFQQWKNYVETHITTDPVLISTTIQFAMRHALPDNAWMESWIDYVTNATGKPPAFFIDECHIGSDGNQIGKLIKLLHDCGAIVVVLTATPHRLDGEQIPGFEYELITSETITKYIATNYSEDVVLIKVLEQLVGTYKMKADYEYTFAEAWAEIPSPLSGIDIITIDFDCTRFVNGREVETLPQKVSKLSPSLAKKILGESVRDIEIVTRGVSTLLSTMHYLRQYPGCEGAAGIIFVGNDTDEEDNREANRVQKIIKHIDPNKKVVIATASTDDAGGIIEAFVNGSGDILIVKMMASLGLDCSRLKVGLDLSPIRSISSFVQRLMRIATNHSLLKRAYWISPADPVAVGLFQWIVTSQDGKIKMPIDVSLIDEYLKPKGEKDEESAMFTNPQKGEVYNHDSIVGRREYHSQFDRFVSRVPQVMAVASQASLMVAFETVMGQDIISTRPIGDHDDDFHIDATEQIRQKRTSIIDCHRSLASLYESRKGTTYKDACIYAWREMRSALSLPGDWNYDAETNLQTLEKCTIWLKKQMASLRSAV